MMIGTAKKSIFWLVLALPIPALCVSITIDNQTPYPIAVEQRCSPKPGTQEKLFQINDTLASKAKQPVEIKQGCSLRSIIFKTPSGDRSMPISGDPTDMTSNPYYYDKLAAGATYTITDGDLGLIVSPPWQDIGQFVLTGDAAANRKIKSLEISCDGPNCANQLLTQLKNELKKINASVGIFESFNTINAQNQLSVYEFTQSQLKSCEQMNNGEQCAVYAQALIDELEKTVQNDPIFVIKKQLKAIDDDLVALNLPAIGYSYSTDVMNNSRIFTDLQVLAYQWKSDTRAQVQRLVADVEEALKTLTKLGVKHEILQQLVHRFRRTLSNAKDPLLKLYPQDDPPKDFDKIYTVAHQFMLNHKDSKEASMLQHVAVAQVMIDVLSAQKAKLISMSIGCQFKPDNETLEKSCPSICSSFMVGAQYCKNELCGNSLCSCYINGCPKETPRAQPEFKSCEANATKDELNTACPEICFKKGLQYCPGNESCNKDNKCACYTQGKGCPAVFAQAYIKPSDASSDTVCPEICDKQNQRYCPNYGSFFGPSICGCYIFGCPPDYRESKEVTVVSPYSGGHPDFKRTDILTSPLPEFKGCLGADKTPAKDCPSICLKAGFQYCPGTDCDEFGQCGCYGLGKTCPAPQPKKTPYFSGCQGQLEKGQTCEQLCRTKNLHYCGKQKYECDVKTYCPCFGYGCPAAGAELSLGNFSPEEKIKEFAKEITAMGNRPSVGRNAYTGIRTILYAALSPSYTGPNGLQGKFTPEDKAVLFDLIAMKLRRLYGVYEIGIPQTSSSQISEVEEINFYFEKAKQLNKDWHEVFQFILKSVIPKNPADRVIRLIAALIYKLKQIHNVLLKPEYTLINRTPDKITIEVEQPSCAKKEKISIDSAKKITFKSEGCPISSLMVIDERGETYQLSNPLKYDVPLEKNMTWAITKGQYWTKREFKKVSATVTELVETPISTQQAEEILKADPNAEMMLKIIKYTYAITPEDQS